MKCRICGDEGHLLLDLGAQPLANTLLKSINDKEIHYPLRFYVCTKCHYGYVNVFDRVEEIFDGGYPYFTSVNQSYKKQCADWAYEYRKEKNPKSVLEIGANDGYMLENFKDIYHVGFEPSQGPAQAAVKSGLNIVQRFFTSTTLIDSFDLIIANNVFAHTPDPLGMAQGMVSNLSENGMIVIEFPSLYNIIENLDYDTIYHEHYSYFSPLSVYLIFKKFGLGVSHIDYILSHGGSYRIYLSKNGDDWIPSYDHKIKWNGFTRKSLIHKGISLSEIYDKKKYDKKMVLFGAAAKGNTFLNYLGIKNDIFDFCVDETPFKQGCFLPGSRVPIVGMERLREEKPDILYILPWNFKEEIEKKTSFISEWGGRHLCKPIL